MRFIVPFVIVLATLASPTRAAPEAALWPRWQAHDPASAAVIDHGWRDRFIATYVAPGADGVNRLPYGRIAQVDRAGLDAYIEGLARLPISTYNRNEQFAYWVNLYNALTVKLVIDHYPVESIRDIDISPGLFALGPWNTASCGRSGATRASTMPSTAPRSAAQT